jgi:hypothetical protein
MAQYAFGYCALRGASKTGGEIAARSELSGN